MINIGIILVSFFLGLLNVQQNVTIIHEGPVVSYCSVVGLLSISSTLTWGGSVV